MRPHEDDVMTAREYQEARLELGLTQEQLAYETGTCLASIKNRESGDTQIRRESQLAIWWLLDNPPETPPERAVRALRPKAKNFRPRDTFGLFTILRSTKDLNGVPTLVEVECRCGRVKVFKATKFHFRAVCGPRCPAHADMLKRGLKVDPHGDIVDMLGYPEK